jgi:8-oxo-dGTP pyrophosphatase MutT (NUDIX family)
MTDRVRAVLITRQDRLLTIKRIKPGQAPYWVLPGGGVDPGDHGLEAALCREIREELAGYPEIHSLLQILSHGSDQHYIYLARIHRWDFADRTGPEFTEIGRGRYILDQVPLTSSDLARIDLVPPETADLLQRAASDGTDLFRLPDLRVSTA